MNELHGKYLQHRLSYLLDYMMIVWENGWIAYPMMESKSITKHPHKCFKCGKDITKFVPKRENSYVVCEPCKVENKRKHALQWKKNHKLKVG